MRAPDFAPGISVLLDRHKSWIKNRKIGLLSHFPAVDCRGSSSVALLYRFAGPALKVLFGPEHGFSTSAAAGRKVSNSKHPLYPVPIKSLYGARRKPAISVLRKLDTIVIDIQDLGMRPYTYSSTIRYMLEAAEDCGTDVIVADRPVPLPDSIDGPMLSPEFESFVASLNVPMSYAMTPGETALWIKQDLGLNLNLKIAKMRGYKRTPHRKPGYPPWIPPSPAITSWESAWCYLTTVFCEALPVIDNARGSSISFQFAGASFIDPADLADRLNNCGDSSTLFHPHAHISTSGRTVPGVRITVLKPERFRPVATSIRVISTIQDLYGSKRLWQSKSARPSFFDKLYGDDTTRKSIQEGKDPGLIESEWKRSALKFRASRKKVLLYNN